MKCNVYNHQANNFEISRFVLLFCSSSGLRAICLLTEILSDERLFLPWICGHIIWLS